VAILQGLISLIARSAGKILNAIFGWAVLALFGRTSPKEQTVLSGVVAAAAVWPILLIGIPFPKVTLFVVSFVPLFGKMGNLWLRIVWIALALIVPIVVGAVIAARSPTIPEPRWKKLLRGFQVTFALAVAFVLMLFIAPGVKIANAAKGWQDVRIPALVPKGTGGELIGALTAVLVRHGIALRTAEPRWYMTAPATVLKKLGGRAFSGFVGEEPQFRASPELQINLNPNELLLRGEPDCLLRGQAYAQEVMAPRPVLNTLDARAQDLESQIKRVWAVYLDRPEDHRRAAMLLRRRDEIARELSQSDVPFDEWQVVYRELLQLDRALRGGSLLLIEKTSEEQEMASENKPDASWPALPSNMGVDRLELERMTNRELLSHTMQTALDLVKKEVELAKVEVKADLQAELGMAKGLGVAGLCAIWAVSMMLVAAAMALGEVIPEWAAALIVAAGVLAVGTIAGLVGWAKRVKKPLETTLRTLKEDARWAKERMA
jgi:hypothetical protein